MPRRELLTEQQRLDFSAPATDERTMVRYYTLSADDLALIDQRRGDHNRLGFAVQFCYLRFPGRVLREDEQPPMAMLDFVAGQLSLKSAAFDDYAQRDQTRRAHLGEIQACQGYRSFSRALYREFAVWLLPIAFTTEKGPALVATLLDELRARQVICPPLSVVERLCGEVRARAQRQLWRKLTDGLSDIQCKALDQLLTIRTTGGQSWLAWLRQSTYAATPGNFPKLIERLKHVRAIGIDLERATRMHQNYWSKLAREGGQSTAQHLADFEPLRRHATLTALALESTSTLTDEALNMFDRLIGNFFKKTERNHADQFHRSGKAINEKVRLYAQIGQALIAAKSGGSDPFEAIEEILPWDKFESTVAEAKTLAQPEQFDSLSLLNERYASARKFAPMLLANFEFQGAPGTADLLQAIDILRDMNTANKRTLPDKVPTSFVRPRWQLYVNPDGLPVDRRYYELRVLSELRDRLRAGDVWVAGSRQYRNFETHLIPAATFQEMRKEPLPLAIETDLPQYLAGRQRFLQEKINEVAGKAERNALHDVTLVDGDLCITPLKKMTPASADALITQVNGMMPHVKITDLLAEVDSWTGFADRFVHLRTNAPPKHRQSLLTSVLADGINLGLTRMAEACRGATLRQLTWTADWHIRDECYSQALAQLTDFQHRQPMAVHWGDGMTSSSDGQYFRAGGQGQAGAQVNLHYGQDPGVKFYTHISDQYGPFHTKVIAATASEAPHVLDGLLYHESSLVIHEHYTDTGGFSDHVFAICHLLGFRFAPRIRDLKDKRLYTIAGMDIPSRLVPLVAGQVNLTAISAYWEDILRLATSIQMGTVTASVILRKLAAYPRQNGLALALRELGKLERTLFTLDWMQDPDLRRRTQIGLNKGEAKNSLSRAVFFHRLGEIRDRSYENQRHRAGGLNLIVAAIILWNTVYLWRAVEHLRKHGSAPVLSDLAHLSPLGWEHINLTGDYHWEAEQSFGRNQFRPLRISANDERLAA
jgi:TnpA family transposase